jgi:hypothetical protein
MLRAPDFGMTDIEITEMAFPRLAAGEGRDWSGKGITLKSLRHPIRNFRKVLRKKWSDARCDPLVFLRLKQGAWASGEVLSLVAASQCGPVKPEDEEAVTAAALEALSFMQSELRAFQQKDREEKLLSTNQH